jgi:hypothetical protein
MSYAACVCLFALTMMGVSSAAAVDRYGVYETSLSSARAYSNPSMDDEVKFEFVSPSGRRTSVDAFWDGGDVWRVRFSPDETGRWRWTSACSDKSNSGLQGRAGTFDCAPYRGRNALIARGPLKLSPDRRYLVHSDGTPFFWLADTAWNGVLKARPRDWERYLSARKSQGFTAVQFVCTQWVAYDSELAFTGSSGIHINPEFFKRLDAKVHAINQHGMVAAPVVLWAVGKGDVGQALSEQDAIRLSKYIVARWGAYNTVWILGGDGNYRGDRAERWRRIGRAVFGDRPERPATMHPGGLQWAGEEFRCEPWFSFIGYQSGHSDSARAVKWLVEGPPATEWSKRPTLPVINLEPNYETILAYESKQPFDALNVRKALYRSLLVSPTAGVTYGHHGIWFWTDTPEVPKGHPKTGIALPWDQAVRSEGAQSVKQLSKLFASIRWWTLRPDPAMVLNRTEDPLRFIASARSENGSLAIVYLPEGGPIELNTKGLKRPGSARWHNPSTGKRSVAGRVTLDTLKLQTPGDGDWVLLIEK